MVDYDSVDLIDDKINFIQEKCRNMKVLDLGCIRHNYEFVLKNKDCLHNKIKEVAKKVIGIDFLHADVLKLQEQGYDIIYGDVCKPIDLDEKFDVIVAGDLIEHLVNFEGFFDNCKKLLKKEGILILSTPNPFYNGEFYYTAFKKRYLVNPEHTCWICPQTLLQLSARFDFKISYLAFIKHNWILGRIIVQSEKYRYDVLTDTWTNKNLFLKMWIRRLFYFFEILYSFLKILSRTNSKLVRYSDYLAILRMDN